MSLSGCAACDSDSKPAVDASKPDTTQDFALIGNCRYSAIIENGAVRWLCWPRMDSSFVFGDMLDKHKGGTYRVECIGATKVTQEYILNTNVLRTYFESPCGDLELIDFAPRFMQHERSFKPAMFVRILRPIRQPRVRVTINPVYDYGKTKSEPVMESNHIHFANMPGNMRLTTNLSLSNIMGARPFVLSSESYLVLSYGQPLEAGLEETCQAFLSKTIGYWRGWVKQMRVPREYQTEVIRSALTLKMHQFEDTGALMAATTTSIPEYPGSGRCWDYRYCWLRDTYFTLNAFERIGHVDEMERFLFFLRDICIGSGDRLQPLYGIGGETEITEHILEHLDGFNGDKPVRIGNQAYEHIQNDAYGEMILAVSRILLDTRFAGGEHGIDSTLDMVGALLNQIEKRLTDPDAGLWELRGSQALHSFTLLTHWAGANACIDIGTKYERKDMVEKAEAVCAEARKILETRCWNEELGCLTQAADKPHLDAAMLLALHFHFLDPTSDKARSHVEAISRELSLEGDEGLLLRYRVEDDFGLQEAAFTVCAFWLVEALAIIGEKDKARALFHKLLGHANSLGLFSEDIHTHTNTQSGNFPQTYSHVGLINSAFKISKDWT